MTRQDVLENLGGHDEIEPIAFVHLQGIVLGDQGELAAISQAEISKIGPREREELRIDFRE